MLVRLSYISKRVLILVFILILSTRLIYTTSNGFLESEFTSDRIIKSKTNAGSNFRVDITSPEFFAEYWEIINITIEITELKSQSWTNISTVLEWETEGKYFLVEGENATHFIGDIGPNQKIQTNYTATASSTKLNDPLVIGYVFVYQGGVEQVVESYSWFEDEYTAWGEANYGLFGIKVQYPLLDLNGPLELGGVIPVLELGFNESTTLTYNISNTGDADLKNLTLEVIVETDLINITTPYTSLETLENKSSILYEIEILCKATEEVDTILYLNITTDVLGVHESSVQIKIVSHHLALNYDNRFVFYSWPVFVFSFVVLALIITVFCVSKNAHTKRIEKLLEEKFGKSYID